MGLDPLVSRAVQVGRSVINFCVKKAPPRDKHTGLLEIMNKRTNEENKKDRDYHLNMHKSKLEMHLANML